MNKIIELNDQNFEQELKKSGTALLVDFYAPWCGPCKMLAPVLDALADEFAGRIQFAKVNVDLAPELAMRHQITGVPTLIIFKNGLILDTIAGMPSPRALKARLDEAAAPAVPTAVVSAT